MELNLLNKEKEWIVQMYSKMNSSTGWPAASMAASPITRSDLCALLCELPDHIQLPMLLGLDGDCDFTRAATESYAYLSSSAELLELISRLSLEQFPRLPHHPDYLVLGRRHAVCLAGIMDAGVGCGYDWMNGEQM